MDDRQSSRANNWRSVGLHGARVGAAKPFAIEGVFAALRSWSPIRAVVLASLGTVAVAYSLTAELSLMAASRADASATRSQAAAAAYAAKARYDAARHELAGLLVTRPVAAIDAEIAKLKTTPKLVPCDDTTASGYGPTTRRVCAQIASLTAEAATTTRRTELLAALTAAEHDLASAPLATDADPAAAALATYLAAVGIQADAAELSRWLALVPVLALEIGSAFAVILAAEAPPQPRATPRDHHAGEPIEADAARAGTVPPATAEATYSPAASDLSGALIEYLRERGGHLRSGQRGLAKTLGASTSELNRTLHSLAAAGVIALSTTPTGTELRLVA